MNTCRAMGCRELVATIYSTFCPACQKVRRQVAQENSTKARLRMKRERLGLDPDPDDTEADMPEWQIRKVLDAADRRMWRFAPV